MMALPMSIGTGHPPAVSLTALGPPKLQTKYVTLAKPSTSEYASHACGMPRIKARKPVTPRALNVP